QVASTFDDGPDPRWTPKILDILKTANAKAAFFLVGVNAEKYPGLVRRIVNEGHEIGNHTYYHPNLALAWPEHVRLELNATQLLIETITGRATTLFRPPYAADTQPSQMSELMPLQIAQDLSYLVVLENIDPQDWAKPGADIILQRIKQQRRDGSIILLHDAGGDRSQTVAALPRILDWLHTRGDTIVPLSTLLGTSRDAVMPPLQTTNRPLARLVSGAGFRVYHALEEFLWAFMIVATALVVARTLLVILLAYRFRRLPRQDFVAPISIVMAAYNEEKVIAGTLRSLLSTDYTCGFNLDRRAYTRWNCITVVPGAISAIRKAAIDRAGGLSLQTLAEDTDLTLSLHKDRQRIVYVPQAIAWTEAPESVRTLARQ